MRRQRCLPIAHHTANVGRTTNAGAGHDHLDKTKGGPHGIFSAPTGRAARVEQETTDVTPAKDLSRMGVEVSFVQYNNARCAYVSLTLSMVDEATTSIQHARVQRLTP